MVTRLLLTPMKKKLMHWVISIVMYSLNQTICCTPWNEPGGDVQIFNVNNNHWITASNIFADIVDLYDSADFAYSPVSLASV